MENEPLVSILMTVFNREKFINEAIDSVIASSYTNWELIIVDDSSKDNSVELARTYADKEPPIKLYINEKNTMIIAGPCAVESEKQILESAQFIKSLGINTLRAGLYKPRTSPYTFQGLGDAGLSILENIKNEFALNIVSEVRDITNFEKIVNIVDIVQIGAKAMYDHSLLKACGEINKPILLKRHFAATIEEFIKAAEFILSAGNEKVILCERGIRTFETKTRFTLDLTSVAYLKKFVNLPIIVDPSHAMGYSYGVPSLAKASLAMGIDGLLVEVHPNPNEALSDSKQQLNHKEFTELYQSLKEIAKATNKKII